MAPCSVPKGGTCSLGERRTLDFFVVSLSLEPHVVCVFNVSDAPMSTHSPVRLILGSKPRQDRMRTMKVPKAHQVDLPAGPQKWSVPDAMAKCMDEQLGSDFAGCMEQLVRSSMRLLV